MNKDKNKDKAISFNNLLKIIKNYLKKEKQYNNT